MSMTETAEMEDGETLSLHQRILSDIREKILSGAWAPGHRIPFEHELTAQYDCSRMTVNKALSQLAKAGLIERRRRSGSFVRQPQSQAAVLELHDIRIEVEALGLPYRYERLERMKRRGNAEDRSLLGLSATGPVLWLEGLHFAGERPFALEQRLINLSAVGEASEEEFLDIAPGPWLIGRVPWSEAEHRIRAMAADETIADTLDIDPGAPCLVVERRTWSAEHPVTHVRFIYPAESHTLVARFTPSQG
ncbi:MAG: histidine utilization repressor [Mesorhizobium sp.]|uniref:histidine utilization repressor n=1 Tax=unclassified Mesorhizobium TaxID=325217 RepID=UPI000BB00432|nr:MULTISPECIES: histidine utilization repressor [unclassified Mesorhizobium]TGV92404.1 histidine utilization repressor [Mesorhizobium sp. M00.F.Ca.ET.158.01.1.1]AZO58174.1 histidine utilization repressor [Mesorhizobium sp. M1A.F.Ca.IN.022.06.1.1]MCT2580849.1 histidine utilization repressor [Mesorhizobium sp. P13.3]MDF3169847.1 histidine utilization repressor [Mesorhizobium sp. P16.1]MDF3179771.1 histidine utilization repressor [Mesorhizobium sp. P17.1]